MVKLLGVDFAPVHVPLERRLQTASVLFYVSCFIVFPFLFTLLAIFALFTDYWWITVGYASWFCYDTYILETSSRGGRRSKWMRNSAHMRYFRDYFPVELVKTADLDPNKNYIIGTHPHGIMGCSLFSNFATEATGFSEKFPGIRSHLLTLKTNFSWPILRGYILWMGCCDVSKKSIEWITTKQGKGNAAVIVIGGAQEALEAKPGNYHLTLKNRKGFVKMAIRTGASLVPVFSFGENDLFVQADNPEGSTIRTFQEKFKDLCGFTPPMFHGRGVFNYTYGLLPYRKPIHTVVGKPIDVGHDPEPSQEDVDKYHSLYMQQLSQLFDEHKVKYGVHPDKTLHFE